MFFLFLRRMVEDEFVLSWIKNVAVRFSNYSEDGIINTDFTAHIIFI